MPAHPPPGGAARRGSWTPTAPDFRRRLRSRFEQSGTGCLPEDCHTRILVSKYPCLSGAKFRFGRQGQLGVAPAKGGGRAFGLKPRAPQRGGSRPCGLQSLTRKGAAVRSELRNPVPGRTGPGSTGINSALFEVVPLCHAGPDRLKDARCPQFCLAETARESALIVSAKQNRHPRAPLRGACGVLDPVRPGMTGGLRLQHDGGTDDYAPRSHPATAR